MEPVARRASVELRLRQAQRHVATGADHIRRQRELIARFERDGHDTAMAEALLETFETVQTAHVADLDRFTAQLVELQRLQGNRAGS